MACAAPVAAFLFIAFSVGPAASSDGANLCSEEGSCHAIAETPGDEADAMKITLLQKALKANTSKAQLSQESNAQCDKEEGTKCWWSDSFCPVNTYCYREGLKGWCRCADGYCLTGGMCTREPPHPTPAPTPPKQCKSTCFTRDCNHWVDEGYDCAWLESHHDCDCSHCSGCAVADKCPKTCYKASDGSDASCDTWTRHGYTCSALETDFHCDCGGCHTCTDGGTKETEHKYKHFQAFECPTGWSNLVDKFECKDAAEVVLKYFGEIHDLPQAAGSPKCTASKDRAAYWGVTAHNSNVLCKEGSHCPKTCFDKTCKEWNRVGYEYKVLEEKFDCDCGGCE